MKIEIETYSETTVHSDIKMENISCNIIYSLAVNNRKTEIQYLSSETNSSVLKIHMYRNSKFTN